jgi:replicative DNA helicase
MGKSAYALEIIKRNCIELKIAGLFFSIEMANNEHGKRLLSNLSSIEFNKLKNPKSLNEHEWKEIDRANEIISNSPIYWDDSSTINIQEIRAKVANAVNDYGIKFIIIDYVQIITGDGDNKEQEVANISRGLKAISKDFDIPVIALAQLSRAVETRGGVKKPMLSDLRHTGQLEQDADSITFIYRPEYYGIGEYHDGSMAKDTAVFIVAKQRAGQVGEIIVGCELKYMRFGNRQQSFTKFQPIDNINKNIESNGIKKKGTDADFTDF